MFHTDTEGKEEVANMNVAHYLRESKKAASAMHL